MTNVPTVTLLEEPFLIGVYPSPFVVELNSSGLSRREPDGHGANRFAGGLKDGIGDGGCDGDDESFAAADCGQIRTIEEMDVQFGNIAEPRNGVLAEARVLHLAAGETHLLAQRRPESHDQRALHLGTEVVGIQDGSAFQHFQGKRIEVEMEVGNLNADLFVQEPVRRLFVCLV